jgi:hypothetical protein
MDERTALAATGLEAFETAQPPSPNWSDADRAWADRVALDAAPAGAPLEAFVGVRARHALQRLAPREPALARLQGPSLREARWTVLATVVAFVVGLLADGLAGSRHINLLAPPMWGVLAWNAFVYLGLVVWPLVQFSRRDRNHRGPIVRGVAERIRRRIRLPRLTAGSSAAALHRFAALWPERSRGLATRRAETLLHAAAAALALGLIAGLYLRGLVFDYRVGWQSTFLSPEAAHAIVSTALAPASRLSGIALPDVAAFAAMREVDGQAAGGAPAAAWIHLLALTLGLVVVLPRALLALVAQARARWRAARFPLPLAQPYYQRLARLQRGGSAQVVVFPYGSVVSPQATLGLRALLADAFGPRVALDVAPGVAFGAEDEAALAVPPRTSHAIALFDLSATPENENQGRFLRRLAAALPAGAALAVLLDDSQFARRFAGLGLRLEERREAWRLWGEAHGSVPLALALEGPAAADAPARLQAAFAAPASAAA